MASDGSEVRWFESHPIAPGATADAFGIFYDNGNSGGNGLNGCNRYCEVIVYTNELTFAERQQVAQYLSAKWLGCDIAYTTVGTEGTVGANLSGATLDVAAGQALKVAVQTESVVAKTGAGELDLGNPVAVDASVTIAGGTAHVKSVKLSRDGLFTQAFLHIDMSDSNTVSITKQNGTNYVTKVKDCDGRTNALCAQNGVGANCLYLTEGDLNGMDALDFGPLKRKMSSWGTGRDAVFKDAGNATVTPKAYTVFAVMGNQGGGGQLLSCHNNSYPGRGWYRALNDYEGDTSTLPLLNANSQINNGSTFLGNSSSDGAMAARKGLMFRKNGAPYNPFTEMEAGYQLISYVSSTYGATAEGMGAAGYRNAVGGMRVTEFILAENAISPAERDYAEAYLMEKWFNVETEGYRPAVLGAVTVAAGATLKVDGNVPLTVASLSGGGAVDGAIVLTENAVFEVPVEVDGTITQTLTVSGGLDISKGGLVRLTGNVANLAPGRYQLVAAANLATVDNWSLTGYSGHKTLSLKVNAAGLWLEVLSPGLMMIVR